MARSEDEEEPVGKRRRSKVEAYYHLVWATKGRQESLIPEWERQVHRLITEAAERHGWSLLAVGGMPDHVHVVVRASGKYSPSEIARLLKGPTSALVNDLRPEFTDIFRWQEGYGCFTLSRTHLPQAIAYVNHQRQHHAENRLWPAWEETDEPAETP